MISKLKNQKYLSLTRQNIGGEDAKYLSQALKDSQISNLNLSKNNIGDKGAKYLSEVLKDTKITNFDLSENNIRDEGAKYLSQALKDSQISHLNLSKNNIGVGDEGAKYLFQALKDSQITTFDLSENNIGVEGAKYLSQALKDSQISHLNLSKNNIGDEGVKYIFQVLKDTQITHLNLSKNYISNEGVKYLSPLLKDTQIITFDLSVINIGADSAQYFNQMLNNTKMRLNLDYTQDYCVKFSIYQLCSYGSIHITIHDNKIGTNGARFLSQTIQNIPIAVLRLDSSTLKNDDAQYLSQAFKDTEIMELDICYDHIMQTNGIQYLTQAFRDSQIARLNVCAQKIRTTGAKYLAEFLKEIKIMDLNLSLNYIGNEGVKYLAPALKINMVMGLDLSWNGIEADGAKYLSEILKDTQITFINLCHNHIGVDGAKYLANGLKYSQVTGIHLHGNMIRYEGYQYLKDIIEDTNLSWVNLHGNDIDQGLEKGTKLPLYRIPRNTATIAEKIRHAFQELVSLSLVSNELEFIVPRKNTYPTIDVDQYFFLINTLKNNPNNKAHVFDKMCWKDDSSYDFNTMKKINEFIITLNTKFITFINDNLPALVELFDDYNYVNLVKQFEDIKLYDIVQNLLLHRGLYYIDDNNEILHPYIYKMLHKYDIILYNTEIEPNKKEKIISYYRNHSEIDGVQEIIDLLRSESFQGN